MFTGTIADIIRSYTHPHIDVSVSADMTIVRTDAIGETHGVLIGFTKYAELAAALGVATEGIERRVTTSTVLARDNRTGLETTKELDDIMLIILIKPDTFKEWTS